MGIFWYIVLFFVGFILGYISFSVYVYIKCGFRIQLKFKHTLIIRRKLNFKDDDIFSYIKASDVIDVVEKIRKKHNICNSSIKYDIKERISLDDIYVKIRCTKLQLENIKLDLIKYCDYFYILEK